MPGRRIIEVSAAAERDIRDACFWIARDNPEAAGKVFQAISLAIKAIPELPGKHSLSPETKLGFTDEVVYQVLCGTGRTKYRILFTANQKCLTVIRVMHGARKFLGQQLKSDDTGE